MLVPFKDLSDSSKIWIYQASRELTDNETSLVKKKLEVFLSKWQSHGKDLIASYKIMYNQFIILAVDQEKTSYSGCSVDASVAVLKELEQDLQVDLFDKMKVTFKIGENINTVALSDFQKYIKEGKITQNTIVFNNLVQTKKEFENNWIVEAKDAWHARFFKNNILN